MIRFVVPYLLYSAIALVCVFLQSQLFSHLQIFNAKPDLLLLVLVMSALKSDWKNGVAVGLLLGFWIDLLNAAFFGTNIIVYGLVGAICGLIGTRFPDRTYEGYFFTAVGASLLSGFLTLLVFQLAGAAPLVGQSVFGIIFPMTFYTSLIAFLGLPLIFLYRRRKGRKIGRIDLLGYGVIYVRGNEKIDLKKVEAERAEARRRRVSSRERLTRRASERSAGRGGSSRSTRAAGSGGRSPRSSSPPRRQAPSRSDAARRRPASGSSSSRNGDYRVAPKKKAAPSSKKPRSYPNRRPQKHRGRRSS